jgi:GT2 family glycosyltransferase
LSKLIEEASANIALLSPKIYYESAPDRIWFAGGQQHPHLLELRQSGRYQVDGPEWGESRDVDYLLGTCLLVNLAAIRQVGLLDECFFMYYEDLDWSFRLRQAGYRLRLVAQAHLYHRVAVSSGGSYSPIRQYYLAQSSVIFFHRHAPKGRPFAIMLFRLGSALKTTFLLAARGQWQAAYAYLGGLYNGWRIATAQKRELE